MLRRGYIEYAVTNEPDEWWRKNSVGDLKLNAPSTVNIYCHTHLQHLINTYCRLLLMLNAIKLSKSCWKAVSIRLVGGQNSKIIQSLFKIFDCSCQLLMKVVKCWVLSPKVFCLAKFATTSNISIAIRRVVCKCNIFFFRVTGEDPVGSALYKQFLKVKTQYDIDYDY
jgi:hypothetical protein